uniref:Uncharacterized protein n=1 Tax=Anguilla anguilla TaxID=7936 RepID=A0A0E9RCT6_ANGAN
MAHHTSHHTVHQCFYTEGYLFSPHANLC